MERSKCLGSSSLEDLITREPVIQKALQIASKAHEGQMRKDGITPYIEHPKAVARICAEEWGIQIPEILAGCLTHDTKEDCNTDMEELEAELGPTVREYVEASTKFESEDKTIRKILTSYDPVPNLIKLADRLHNMRTLEFVPVHRQVPIATQTGNIYCPLAESLGLWIAKTELEDLAFKYIDPEAYKHFALKQIHDPRLSPEIRNNMVRELQSILDAAGIKGHIDQRQNSIARLKAKSDRQDFREIGDLNSYRIIVDDLNTPEATYFEVYKAFAAVRSFYKDCEDQTRLDDFYAHPRENKYSAIQMTIDTPEGAVELAVSSKTREDFNNWGVVSLLRDDIKDLSEYRLKLVITPRGVAKFTVPGATGVDLAYLINPDFGLRQVGMLVDGEHFDITQNIPNGANVEILLGTERIRPDPDLTKHAVLDRTKRVIDRQNREANARDIQEKGREMVSAKIMSRGIIDMKDLLNADVFPVQAQKLTRLLQNLGCKGLMLPDLYYRIGSGGLSVSYFEKLLDEIKITKADLGITSIYIEGTDQPGTLNKLTSDLKQRRGNIRINTGIAASNRTFTQRLLVEGLTTKAESKLREIYGRDPNIKSIIIV